MSLLVRFGSHETGISFYVKLNVLSSTKGQIYIIFHLLQAKTCLVFDVCFVNFVATKVNGAYRLQVSTIHVENRMFLGSRR